MWPRSTRPYLDPGEDGLPCSHTPPRFLGPTGATQWHAALGPERLLDRRTTVTRVFPLEGRSLEKETLTDRPAAIALENNGKVLWYGLDIHVAFLQAPTRFSHRWPQSKAAWKLVSCCRVHNICSGRALLQDCRTAGHRTWCLCAASRRVAAGTSQATARNRPSGCQMGGNRAMVL